jgi:acetyl esterase/lipase
MDVIKLITPDLKPGEFALPYMDVTGVKRKYLDIPYVPGGGNDQSLDIYLPDEGEGPFPVIVFIHGGAFWGGDKRDFQCTYLMDGIRRGYAVVNVNHRLSHIAKFPQPVFDVKAAIRFLRGNAEKYCLDKSRFAVGGDSAGSYFAAILGTGAGIPALEDPGMGYPDEDTSVQAVIGLFGVYDLEKQSRFTEEAPAAPGGAKMGNFADIFLGLNCREYPDIARLAWPGSYVRPDCPPFLIQAGTSDEVVPYENSPDLANRINAVCGEGRAIMEPFPGRSHGHPDFGAPENVERMFAFLDSVLK